MIKVMFVCHGNICRSPMAEMILKDMVRKRGLTQDFLIASSATSTEEICGGRGNPVYPPARAVLAQHGIPCEQHHAVQLRRSDYEAYDWILCMDRFNQRNILRIIGSDPAHKVHQLLEFAANTPMRDVADPWYSGDFETAYADIMSGCEGFLQHLEQQGLL